jgi:parvulin-like peptidyl-prolyl isomerase
MVVNRALFLTFIGATVLMGCSLPNQIQSTAQPTPTILPPTETPIPMAAMVAGEPILLADFEGEIHRFEAAQIRSGIDLATIPGYREQILHRLIDQKLLALGAQAGGLKIEDAAVDLKIQQIVDERGEMGSLDGWLEQNQYSQESFRRSLALELMASKMVEMITAQIPETIVQVHARHIVVASREEAEWLRAQIEAGEPFDGLAEDYSLDTSTGPIGGDLGWFPEDYLLIPEITTAAFSTPPGEISDIVETQLGFHLVSTIEIAERALSYDALVALRERTVVNWIEAQRELVDLQIFIDP